MQDAFATRLLGGGGYHLLLPTTDVVVVCEGPYDALVVEVRRAGCTKNRNPSSHAFPVLAGTVASLIRFAPFCVTMPITPRCHVVTTIPR